MLVEIEEMYLPPSKYNFINIINGINFLEDVRVIFENENVEWIWYTKTQYAAKYAKVCHFNFAVYLNETKTTI